MIVNKFMKALFLLLLPALFLSVSAEADSDVGSGGDFSYSIPISLPAGTHGMQPQLSLLYNSMGGDSLVGVGWGIGGIPVITRDGRYPIHFDGGDHYMFMGQKLLVDADGNYHTENESHLRIQAFNLNSSQSYWVVTQTNGNKMYFGYVPDLDNNGHIQAVGQNGKALLWSLSKVEDTNGNFYTISYLQDDTGAYYPDEIKYTQGNGISKFKTVDFVYGARPDYWTKYMPTQMKVTQRLTDIYVRVDGAQLNHYKLTYARSSFTGRSLLKSVQTYGTDDQSANQPVTFAYSQEGGKPQDLQIVVPGSGQAGDPYQTTLDLQETNLITGDFNGDGLSDWIRQEKGDWANDNVNSFQIYYSKGDGTYDIVTPHSDQESAPGGASYSVGKDIFQYDLKAENGDGDPQNGANLLVGDFNGDGKDDFLRQEKGNGSWGRDTIDSFEVYFSQGQPSAGEQPFVRVKPGSNVAGDLFQDLLRDHPAVEPALGDTVRTKLAVGDFNGDGKSDFVAIRPNQWVKVYYSEGDGNFHSVDITLQFWGAGIGADGTSVTKTISQVSDAMVGDYNGDGKADLLYFVGGQDSGGVRFRPYWAIFGSEGVIAEKSVALPQNKVGFPAANPYPGAAIDYNALEYAIGDFNGDGRSDVVQSIPFDSTGVKDPGDGESILDSRLSSHFFRIYLSTNGGYETCDYADPQVIERAKVMDYHTNAPLSTMRVGDFNGDGKSDIADLAIDPEGLTYHGGPFYSYDFLGLYYSVGDYTASSLFQAGIFDEWTPLWSENSLFVPLSIGLTAGDFDGDGMMDLLQQYSDPPQGIPNMEQFLSGNRHPDLLLRADNGYGGVTQIGYKSLHQSGAANPTFSRLVPGAFSPADIPFTPPLPLVNQITYDDGVGNSYTDQYLYRGGLIHTGPVAERKSLGFQTITQMDALGNQTETEYNQSVDLAGTVRSNTEYAYRTDTGTLAKNAQTTYEYEVQHSPEGIATVHVSKTMTDYFDPGSGAWIDATAMVYPAYDSYGNLTRRINMGSLSDPADDYETDYRYAYNRSDYVIMPYEQTVRAYDPLTGTTGAIQSDVKMNYDRLSDGQVAKGNVTRTLNCANGAESCSAWEISQDQQYDTHGNLVSSVDANRNEQKTVFDSFYHQLPTRISNALGQTSMVAYDNLGRAISATDINQRTVTTVYDALSRPTAVITPGTDENHPEQAFTYELNRNSDGKIIGVCTVMWNHPDLNSRQIVDGIVQYTAEAVQSSCKDGMGQTIQTKTRTGDGSYSTVDTLRVYDGHTAVTYTSVPYMTATLAPTDRQPQSGQATADKQYFTSQGAVTEHVAPDGTSAKTVVVSPFFTLDYAAGSSVPDTKTYFDGNGRAVKVEGLSAYATYVYRPGTTLQAAKKQYDKEGTLLSSSSTSYNLRGQIRSVDDADMGHLTYTYDPGGRLKTFSDAKGQTVLYSYDDLNRLTRIQYPGNSTKYMYDEHGNKGYLTTVRYNSGNSEGRDQYTYDAMGRVASMSRTLNVNGVPVTKTMSYSYNALGNLQTVTYPDGEQVTNAYRDGRLQAVSGDAAYVSAVSYTNWGAVSQLAYGNGTTVNYGYKDPASGKGTSYLLDSISVNGGHVALHESYSYDNRYLLTNMTDQTDARYNQVFSYDELYRLTQDAFPASDQGKQEFSYNPANGIAAQNNRAHTYGDAAHPHAVTDDGTFRYTYDANGNMTSRTPIVTRFKYTLVTSSVGKATPTTPKYLRHQNGQGKVSELGSNDPLIADSQWKVVPGLADPHAVSFESVNYPGQFLRHQNGELWLAANDGSDLFKKDATWWIEPYPSDGSRKQIRSYNYPQQYIGVDNQNLLKLAPNAALFIVENAASGERRDLAYNSTNQLIRVTDTKDGASTVIASYAYDPSGQRIMKTEGSTTTYYWFPQYEETYVDGQLTASDKYYYAGSYTPVAWRHNDALYYLYTDHQGSVARVADRQGNQVGMAHYTPYGAMADASGVLPEFRYTGQIWDDSTGLYYYNARYYDPMLGTFITADTASPGYDMNRYAYGDAAPSMNVDPSGHYAVAAVGIIGAGLTVAGVISYGVGAAGKAGNNQAAMIAGLTLMGVGLSLVGGAIGSVAMESMETVIGISVEGVQLGSVTVGSIGQAVSTGVSLVGQAFLSNVFEYAVSRDSVALSYQRNLVDAAIFFAGGVFMGGITSQGALRYLYRKGANSLVREITDVWTVEFRSADDFYVMAQNFTKSYGLTGWGEGILGYGMGNLSFGFVFMPAMNVARHAANPNDGSNRYIDGVSWVFDPLSFARGATTTFIDKGIGKFFGKFAEKAVNFPGSFYSPLKSASMQTIEAVSKRVGLFSAYIGQYPW